MSRHLRLGAVSRTLTCLFLVAAASCGTQPGPTTPTPVQPTPGFPASTTFEFTAAPIAFTSPTYVSWPGYEWAGGLSSSMVFAQVWGSDAVIAPGTGMVQAIRPDGETLRVDFLGLQWMRFYLPGLATTSVAVGDRVVAGDRVGTRQREPRLGRLGNVRLGVMNLNAPNSFIAPYRYPDEVRLGEDPLKYFVESLRSQIRGYRGYPDAEGRLDYDIPGTLMGLWFHESVPLSDSLSSSTREQRLWFFYTYDAQSGGCCGSSRTLRVSTPMIWTSTPLPGSLHPKDITPAAGFVVLHLERSYLMPSWPQLLLVEMLSATTVRAEGYWGPADTAPAYFTDRARTYIR